MLHKNDETLLDRATAQIQAAEPDAQQAQDAAARVWSRLTNADSQAMAEAAEVEEIRGCDDYQALIPAFLADGLPEARRMLLEDHTRECVPCRRALLEARDGKLPRRSQETANIRRRDNARRATVVQWTRWAVAAMLVLGLGLGGYAITEKLFWSGPTATVHTVDGNLFRVDAAAQILPVALGDVIDENEVLRTGRDGGAIVQLRDGSLVEMNARSEMSIRRSPSGTTLDLTRGNVIVQAAPQGSGHLFVKTEDCLVSVTGTIFSVNHGTKGSRVAVIEGEVHVDHAGEETILRPGDQVSTDDALGKVAVKDEIAWSRDVNRYIQMLEELSVLRQELRERVSQPELRYSSRLLDLMPEGTLFFAAVPNLADTLTDAHQVITERLQESPALAEWWQQGDGDDALAPMIDDVVGKLGELGDYLGDEIAVGGYGVLGDDGEHDINGLGLAEITDAAGLQGFLLRLGAELGQRFEFELDGDEVLFVQDPRGPLPEAELYLWLHDDLAVLTADAEPMHRVGELVLGGAANPFVAGDFHASIAALYDDGVGFLVAADLEHLVAEHNTDNEHAERFAQLGVDNARHLLFEQKTLERSHHKAVVTFADARHGIASWLAEPAPMGSLDFISPDAKLVTAVVFKDPVAMLDEMLGFAEDDARQAMEDFQNEHGLSLRDDLAAVLGGEMAFAIDGPMLPEVSWKLILEVYDPARLQWTLEQIVEEANDVLRREGEEEILLTSEEVGGRTFYTVAAKGTDSVYTYIDGYFVAAANRGLLERAIRFRESGYGIADSARFADLLPPDGNNNFSALLYQDLGSWLAAAAEQIAQGQLTEEQQARLGAIREMTGPTLAYAYGETDRITLAASTQDGLLTAALHGILGMGSPAGWGDLLALQDALPVQ